MNAYLTELVVRRYRRGIPGRAFITAEPLEVQMPDGSRLRAPASMATDLASVPRAFRPFFDRLGPMLEASVIHDAAYCGQLQLRFEHRGSLQWPLAGLNRREADRAFWELLRAAGVGRCRAWLLWCAVRVGGRRAWRGRS